MISHNHKINPRACSPRNPPCRFCKVKLSPFKKLMQESYLNLDEDVILDMDAYSRRKRPADFKKRNLLKIKKTFQTKLRGKNAMAVTFKKFP